MRMVLLLICSALATCEFSISLTESYYGIHAAAMVSLIPVSKCTEVSGVHQTLTCDLKLPGDGE